MIQLILMAVTISMYCSICGKKNVLLEVPYGAGWHSSMGSVHNFYLTKLGKREKNVSYKV